MANPARGQGTPHSAVGAMSVELKTWVNLNIKTTYRSTHHRKLNHTQWYKLEQDDRSSKSCEISFTSVLTCSVLRGLQLPLQGERRGPQLRPVQAGLLRPERLQPEGLPAVLVLRGHQPVLRGQALLVDPETPEECQQWTQAY